MREMKMPLKISNLPRFLTIFCFAISKWIFSTPLGGHMHFFVYADTTPLGLSGTIRLASLC